MVRLRRERAAAAVDQQLERLRAERGDGDVGLGVAFEVRERYGRRAHADGIGHGRLVAARAVAQDHGDLARAVVGGDQVLPAVGVEVGGRDALRARSDGQRRGCDERAVAVAGEDRHVVGERVRDGQVERAVGVEERRDECPRARSDGDGRSRPEPARAVAQEHEHLAGGLARRDHVRRAVAVHVPDDHGRRVVARGLRDARREPACAVAEVELDLAGSGRALGHDDIRVAVDVHVAYGHRTRRGAQARDHRTGAEAAVDVAQDPKARVVRRRHDQVRAPVVVEVGGRAPHGPVARGIGARRPGERGPHAGHARLVLDDDDLAEGRVGHGKVVAPITRERADREAERVSARRQVGGVGRRVEVGCRLLAPEAREARRGGGVEHRQVEDAVVVEVGQRHARRSASDGPVPLERERRAAGRALEDRGGPRAAVGRHEIGPAVPVQVARGHVDRIATRRCRRTGDEAAGAVAEVHAHEVAAADRDRDVELAVAVEVDERAAVVRLAGGVEVRDRRRPEAEAAAAIEPYPLGGVEEHDQVVVGVARELAEQDPCRDGAGIRAEPRRARIGERRSRLPLQDLHGRRRRVEGDHDVLEAVVIEVGHGDVDRIAGDADRRARGRREAARAVAQQDADVLRSAVGDREVEPPVAVPVSAREGTRRGADRNLGERLELQAAAGVALGGERRDERRGDEHERPRGERPAAHRCSPSLG